MSKPKLEACPFCGKTDKLVAGYSGAMSLAVRCTRCYCTGPVWSDHRVTGRDERLLRSFAKAFRQWLAETGQPAEKFDDLEALDSFLLAKAVVDWNTRPESRKKKRSGQ